MSQSSTIKRIYVEEKNLPAGFEFIHEDNILILNETLPETRKYELKKLILKKIQLS